MTAKDSFEHFGANWLAFGNTFGVECTNNMKKEPLTHNQAAYDEFVIVPKDWLQSIADTQEKILSLLKEHKSESTGGIGDYISESEAKQLLGRKTTWFWKMRSSGQLAYSRVGNKIFYLKEDILNLISKHHSANTNQYEEKI